MPITQNYRVPVYVDGQEHSSVFYRTDRNQFDLRYGWASFTTSMHSSLADAKADFFEQLKKKYPSRQISLGTEIPISPEEALCLSPTYEALRED